MSFSILPISSAEQADMPAPMDVEAPELEHQEKSKSESGSASGSGSGLRLVYVFDDGYIISPGHLEKVKI